MITMDYRLIEQCKAGDAAAVEDFVQTYQREVYCLALSILDDSGEAEDATLESLGRQYSFQLFMTVSILRVRLSPRLGVIPLK
jgi:hypothetical protein